MTLQGQGNYNEKNIRILTIDNVQQMMELFGAEDEYLKALCDAFGVKIVQRDEGLILEGVQSQKAEGALLDMLWILKHERALDKQKFDYVI